MAARKSDTKQEVNVVEETVVDESVANEDSTAVVESISGEIVKEEKIKGNPPVKKESPLNKDDVIEVVSLVHNVSYYDKKYGDTYIWEKAGDIVEMPFEIVSHMWQNYKSYFKAMWLKPLDNRVVKKFALESTYKDYDFLMEPSNYTNKTVEDICKSISKTPQSLKSAVCNKIKSFVADNKITDIYVISVIEKRLNIDLISLISVPEESNEQGK